MATIKQVTLPSGVEVNYWRIFHLQVTTDQKRAIVHWAGYLTDEARASGKTPAHEMSETIPINSEALAVIYQMVTSVGEFKDSEPYVKDEWKNKTETGEVVE